METAANGDEKSWERAKAALSTLHQQMLTSPDMTRQQAEMLTDRYIEDLNAIWARARRIENMPLGEDLSPESQLDELTIALNKRANILDL